MTLGSLLFEIGFIDKGVGAGLTNVERGATKAALVLTAMNAALYAMLATAAAVGKSLTQFSVSTGLSADNLQLWQQRAAAAGVSGADLANQIKHLQDEATAFKLGEPKNVGVWSLLGVDPRASPDVVMNRLHVALRAIKDVAVARELASRVGVGDSLFQVLMGSDEQFNDAQRLLILDKQQIGALNALGIAWDKFKLSLGSLKNQVSAVLAPAFEGILKGLTGLIRLLALAANWLKLHPTLARALATGVAILSVAILALTAAFGALSAIVAVAGVVVAAFELEILPVTVAAFGITIAVLAAVAAFVGLLLVVEDLNTAANGGDSFFEWSDGMKSFAQNIQSAATAMGLLLEYWSQMKGIDVARTAFNFAGRAAGLPFDASRLFGSPSASTAGATVTQENNVNINVNGASDPKATGRATVDAFQTHLNNAGRQMPVDNF